MHSLKPPFGVQYWTLGGDASLTENYIRLVEDRQSKKGSFWNTLPCDLNEWEASFQYRIHGVSKVGADGMAFWYTESSQRIGELFGNQAFFKGLGIVIDTYDNDRTGKHPYLSVLLSDGLQAFEHDHAEHGSTPKKPGIEKGGCSIAARNLKNPSTIRVTYSRGLLSVFVDIETSGNPRSCVQNVPVSLPKGYFFGFTAATGHLADNHDLHSFSVRSLDPYQTPQKIHSYQGQDSGYGRETSGFQQDASQRIISSQNEISVKIDQLNSLVRQLSNNQRQDSNECSTLSHSISNVLKSLERLDKEQSKRFSDLKSSVPTPRESGMNWLGWLTLVLLVVVLIINVASIVALRNDKELKRKTFF